MNKLLTKISIGAIILFSSATLALAQSPGTNQPQTNANTSPTLAIITPSEGQTIYGNKIPILFSVENFEIVDYKTNTAPKVGQGHIHLWLDEASQTKENATKVVEDNFTYSDVPFGQHTLVAELVSNDHNSIVPPQKATVKFTNAQISTPEAAAATGFDKKTGAVILVVVALVIVAAWWYTKDEDEEEMEVKQVPKTKAKRTAKRRGK